MHASLDTSVRGTITCAVKGSHWVSNCLSCASHLSSSSLVSSHSPTDAHFTSHLPLLFSLPSTFLSLFALTCKLFIRSSWLDASSRALSPLYPPLRREDARQGDFLASSPSDSVARLSRLAPHASERKARETRREKGREDRKIPRNHPSLG